MKPGRSARVVGAMITLLVLTNLFCGSRFNQEAGPEELSDEEEGQTASVEGDGPQVVTRIGEEESPGTAEPVVEPTATDFPPTTTPTRVPPTPTSTSVPPTPTPDLTATADAGLSGQFASFTDDIGDAAGCQSNQAADDPEVDIVSVNYNMEDGPSGAVTVEVRMAAPLIEDYSAAVALFYQGADGTLLAWLWEIHENTLRIGPMDPDTFQLTGQTVDGLEISHDDDQGLTRFRIPLSDDLPVAGRLFVRSFHTGQAGEVVKCDAAGPYDVPEA